MATVACFRGRDRETGTPPRTQADRGGPKRTNQEQHPHLSPDRYAALLADALAEGSGPQRDQQVIEFELYLAALRRPALRPIADQYTELSLRTLAHYTDPDTAAAATAALNGLALRALANTTPPTRAQIEAVLRRILTPNPALPPAT
ncbi:hypothetical protein [Streptomyces sp. cmx-4-9]|uniref:hypothetical protein n=1 Tax=Streptomyces sp. cmx-4-9 TaxID=2790941 RepID=UPI003980F178